MSVKLLYFAWVREKTGIGEERVDVPDGVETVSDLIQWLKARGPEFESAFEQAHVIRTAIDQTHVSHDAPVANASEIAFFPPVTGG
jgi:molybdopterin synthase sulfur carrier subunit